MTFFAKHRISYAPILGVLMVSLSGCIIIDDYSSSKSVYQGRQMQSKRQYTDASKHFVRAVELAHDVRTETAARKALAENLEKRGLTPQSRIEREQLVALGDREALKTLSAAISKGNYHPTNKPVVAKALVEAADTGSLTASVALGDLLRQSELPNGVIKQQDPEVWYRKASENGSVTGTRRLLDLAAEKGDEKTVIELAALDKARPPTETYKRLAKSFDAGSDGFNRNVAKADLYWKLAGGRPAPKARSKPRDEIVMAAKALSTVKSDAEKKRLIALLDKAANKGSAKAAYALARYYAPTGETNSDAALKYFAIAAANGERRAVDEVVVGTVRPSLGLELSGSLVTSLEKAAIGGNPDAALALAQMHLNGTVVKPDSNKTLEWFRKAAKLGSQEAQFRLGVMLTEGQDEATTAEGKDWLKLASRNGSKSAKIYLDRLVSG